VKRHSTTLITGICTALACSLAFADSTTHDGIFTTAQAQAGKVVYDLKCAHCHGTRLEGAESGGALAGSAFQTKWFGLPLETLRLVMRTTMPLDAPGALSDADYENALAYLLSQNGVGLVAGKASSTVSTEWLHHRGDPGSTNYSPLDLINKDNVAGLEVAWRWRSDNFGPGIWPNLQTTPIMADGVLYATAGSRRTVVAIDAASGETLWMHRVDEGARGDNAPRKGPGRGVAFWRDDVESRVFVITPGYQLLALDAASGQPVTEFGANGHVDLKLALDQDLDLTDSRIGASSPPIIVGDVVIVGAAFPAGGAPPSKEMPVGNISAYDVRSGERRWIFNTLPQAGEAGHDTWQDDAWSYTGNIGVWAPMSADPELGYVYLPVEAATGDFYGGHRPGNNLYSQSLVCLDARTGERVWHFQTVHHGIWDYDLPTAPILVDVQRDGRTIPAVAQLTKQGFTFVFDRRTGEPVWPIEERAVPQSNVPDEKTSATQPFPTLPVPFAVQGVGPDTVNNLTPEIHAEALRIIESGRAGPLFTPPTLETESNVGTFLAPGASGGANWQGGVADPESDVLYVSSTNTIGIVGLISAPDRSNMRYVLNRKQPEKPFGLPLGKPPWGTITAIDLKTGQQLWQIANGDTPEYVTNHPKLQGVELPRTGHDERAGLLVTKSLLFAGEGAGLYVATEGGSKFRAHDKATGEILHEIDLGANQSGLPMTYAINGRQYIVLAVGAPNQAGELVALSILRGQSQ
jgi:quinoprotein glucose dehydrogenase